MTFVVRIKILERLLANSTGKNSFTQNRFLSFYGHTRPLRTGANWTITSETIIFPDL